MGADVDSRDNNHRTPLMWAAKRNQLKCAEILFDFKASPGLQDIGGYSALHVACVQGHAAFVSLLLDRGASLMLCNKQEFACLEVAAKAGSDDVAITIVKHKRLSGVINCFFTSYFGWTTNPSKTEFVFNYSLRIHSFTL